MSKLRKKLSCGCQKKKASNGQTVCNDCKAQYEQQLQQQIKKIDNHNYSNIHIHINRNHTIAKSNNIVIHINIITATALKTSTYTHETTTQST